MANSGQILTNIGLAVTTVSALTKIVDNVYGPRSNTLPPGAESFGNVTVTKAVFGSGRDQDWRVKLSLPSGYAKSPIMSPLSITGGFVFPYTPSMTVKSSAIYNTMDVTHNNYPFFAYNNSKVDSIEISGDFYCENSDEAKFWVASVHYLRSVTKMHYGDTTDAGAPPPIVKLNGYGDYVFKDVPVIVTQFSVELPNDVDYISAEILEVVNDEFANRAIPGISQVAIGQNTKITKVPIKSRINVTVQPLYSREQVRTFSLDKFVKGEYVFNGKGYI